jgi:hypothetical protein
MKNTCAILVFVLTFCLFAKKDYATKIESYMEKTGVLLEMKTKLLGEMVTLDDKRIEFSSTSIKDIKLNSEAKGVELAIFKSKRSDKFKVAYIDYDEIESLITNLKEVWNYTSSAKTDERLGLFLRTASGFTVALIEPSQKDLDNLKSKYISSRYYEGDTSYGIKRFVFIATGETMDEAENLDDYEDILKLDGFAILSLEGIKDIISYLEKIKA